MRAIDPLWIQEIPLNPNFPLDPSVYDNCFRRALRRLALAINSKTSKQFGKWLKRNDESIEEFKQTLRLDRTLWTFGHITIHPGKPEEEEAQYYFYGPFNLRPARTARKAAVVVEYLVYAKFFKLSYKGLIVPRYDAALLGTAELNDPSFLQACATNYLLKNLWHTWVHTRCHGINFSNYREFGGLARFESDIEADNLANILLVKSHGLPVAAEGFEQDNAAILQVLRRNRCNKVFGLRAGLRRESQSPEEKEKRYCRFLSNYISGWLVAAGRAATTLGVYFTGEGRRRDRRIVVLVNGHRIATSVRPLPENFGGASLSEELEEERRKHCREITSVVHSRYRELLDTDTAFRRYAETALRAVLRLAGFNP